MRRFYILFATFFVVSLMALGAAYIDSKMRPARNEEHLWHDTLQRLNELGRTKHHQSIRYNQYARHAQQMQSPNMAALFSALAYAEGVKCEVCKNAIGSLGGLFDAPISTSTDISDIRQHLQNIVDEKIEYHDIKALESITGAMDEGSRYVARMMTWCDASDMKMILLVQQALDQMADTSQTEGAAPDDAAPTFYGYWVCPKCGNIFGEERLIFYCPHCMTRYNEFLLFK